MSFFDRLLNSLERFISGREVNVIQSINARYEKFVSGLFYCQGQKKQYYALTVEDEDTDREFELLERLSETFTNCSDMRENHGYSIKEIQEEPDPSQEYPNVEIGEL